MNVNVQRSLNNSSFVIVVVGIYQRHSNFDFTESILYIYLELLYHLRVDLQVKVYVGYLHFKLSILDVRLPTFLTKLCLS